MFVLFAVFIAALILGIGPFAAAPSTGSAEAGAGVATETPSVSAPATDSRSTQPPSTNRRTTVEQPSTANERQSPTADRNTTATAVAGFKTVTDRSSPTARSPVESFDTVTQDRTSEGQAGGNDETRSEGQGDKDEDGDSSGGDSSESESEPAASQARDTGEDEETTDRDASATEQSETSRLTSASEREANSDSDSENAVSTTESAATTATGGYSTEDLTAELESEDISIETLFIMEGSVSSEGPTTVLEYTTQASAGGYRDKAGRVGRVYASAVERGYQPESLSVTVYTDNDDPVATYRIERAWASAYANGNISAQEYGELIGETFRSYN